jgi:hypothetical protein
VAVPVWNHALFGHDGYSKAHAHGNPKEGWKAPIMVKQGGQDDTWRSQSKQQQRQHSTTGWTQEWGNARFNSKGMPCKGTCRLNGPHQVRSKEGRHMGNQQVRVLFLKHAQDLVPPGCKGPEVKTMVLHWAWHWRRQRPPFQAAREQEGHHGNLAAIDCPQPQPVTQSHDVTTT